MTGTKVNDRSVRVWCVFGTRPEVIKQWPVVRALERYPSVEVRKVFTGQHADLAHSLIKQLEMQPDLTTDTMRPSQELAALFGRTLEQMAKLMRRDAPDLVLVQGDTVSATAAAFAAFLGHVPVGHVEAGLRSGDLQAPFPEEALRITIDGMTDLAFCPTPLARSNVAAGARRYRRRLYLTGNTAVDAAREILRSRKYRPTADVARWVRSRRPLLFVTLHRRENHGPPLRAVLEGLADFLARFPDIRCVLPAHPNPTVQSILSDFRARLPAGAIVPPLSYVDTLHVIRASSLILTDSGGIQEEAPALGHRVLVARTVTERPEGIAAGVARLVHLDACAILDALTQEWARVRTGDASFSPDGMSPYGDGSAGLRIADAAVHFLLGTPRTTRDLTSIDFE